MSESVKKIPIFFLLLALVFSVIICANISIGNDHAHHANQDMNFVGGHLNHAQSLILANIFSLILNILLYVSFFILFLFSIEILKENSQTYFLVEKPVPKNREPARSFFNLRAPPEY